MDDVTPVVAALKKSGFPLQTRIEYEIKVRFGRGWRVLASEHPWRGEDGDQFIDLIANCGTVVLVIECKKAQDRSLLFLRPVGAETTDKVRRCMVWHFEPNGAGSSFGLDMKERDLEPESYQAAFCVTTTDRSQRLLEQDARPVVLATDALLNTNPMFPQIYRLGRSFKGVGDLSRLCGCIKGPSRLPPIPPSVIRCGLEQDRLRRQSRRSKRNWRTGVTR